MFIQKSKMAGFLKNQRRLFFDKIRDLSKIFFKKLILALMQISLKLHGF